MSTVSVANTSANISGKTLVAAEVDVTVTGNWTFSRGASAPFVVNVGAALVSNLVVDAAIIGGSGVVPSARLGTGAADATVFLRGDGTWAVSGGLDYVQMQSFG